MPADEEQPSCSFCGRYSREVQKLIAGPKVHICDDCVFTALGILCREMRGISFRIGYFLFASVLKINHGFRRIINGGRILPP